MGRQSMGTLTMARLKRKDVLPLSKDVRAEVTASRKRKDSELIKHTDVLKEFC